MHPFMRNEYTANLAERFFPGYECTDPSESESESARAGLEAEIAATAKSCHDYLAFLLLDFATVDPDGGDAHLAWTLDLADQVGLFGVYEPVVQSESFAFWQPFSSGPDRCGPPPCPVGFSKPRWRAPGP